MSETKTNAPASATDGPVGIGGWLILVVLGLVLNPLLITKSLIVDFLPLFTQGTWEQLTTPGTGAYHPFWQPLLLFEIGSNLCLMALAIICLVHLFRKSHRTPKLMISYLTAQAIVVVIDFFLGDLIPTVAAQSGTEEVKGMVRALAAAAVWIPYFCVSKRVKATFVR